MPRVESNLFCTQCESEVINDLPNWFACYCGSAEIDDVMEYLEHWTSFEVMKGQENSYADDT
jgi:hypothetical protein